MSSGPEQLPPPPQQQQQAPNLRVLQKGLQNERPRQAGSSPGQPAASPAASTSTANPNADSRSALLAWMALPCTRAAACLACAVPQHSSAPSAGRVQPALLQPRAAAAGQEANTLHRPLGRRMLPCHLTHLWHSLACKQACPWPLRSYTERKQEYQRARMRILPGGPQGNSPPTPPMGVPTRSNPPAR